MTLQPRLIIVIRYSLGGDTDKSNTAWVRTLYEYTLVATVYDALHFLCKR